MKAKGAKKEYSGRIMGNNIRRNPTRLAVGFVPSVL
jgi:hypothetical protein